MKKLIPALLAISTTATASEVKWDYLEVSDQKVKGPGMEFSGYGFGGAALTGGGLLLTANKRDLDHDFRVRSFNVNLGVEVLSIGFGGVTELSESTDFFFTVNYLDIKTSAEISAINYSISDSDSGKGATLGVRSMMSNSWELSAMLDYTAVISGNTSKVFGAHYHLSNEFSLGINYSRDDEEKGTSITARLYL